VLVTQIDLILNICAMLGGELAIQLVIVHHNINRFKFVVTLFSNVMVVPRHIDVAAVTG
jgi:hypothetical protein